MKDVFARVVYADRFIGVLVELASLSFCDHYVIYERLVSLNLTYAYFSI